MGRPRRFQLPGVPQLVSQRGHNRLPCFIDGDDFSLFRELLRDSAGMYDCRVDALLLLPDSYWTVLVPSDAEGMSRTLQRTGRLYVRHANRKYRRLGTLWAERYRACPLEPSEDWLFRVGQYLELMPRRRGMIAEQGSWPWWESSLPQAKLEECGELRSQIESALRSGRVLGSREFHSLVEARCGQSATPRRRGRPPRSD